MELLEPNTSTIDAFVKGAFDGIFPVEYLYVPFSVMSLRSSSDVSTTVSPFYNGLNLKSITEFPIAT